MKLFLVHPYSFKKVFEPLKNLVANDLDITKQSGSGYTCPVQVDGAP